MSKTFEIGSSYFLLEYLDKDFDLPIITTLVFIGVNLDECMREADLWYFQDAESYVNHGAYVGVSSEMLEESNETEAISGTVFDVPETQLGNVLSVGELINELGELARQSSRLNP